MGRTRTIPAAARELCLAFPEAEEFESHGAPNYRARKGKIFATWTLNHHGDGHVALWLNTPALEQSRLLASSRHVYKPPYVGPSGWIAVELNKGVSWKRVCELVHMAYVNSSPAKLAARIPVPPRGGGAHREDEARRDRSHARAEGAEDPQRAARNLRRTARSLRGHADGFGGLAGRQTQLLHAVWLSARDSRRSSGWASSGRVRSRWIRGSRSRATWDTKAGSI